MNVMTRMLIANTLYWHVCVDLNLHLLVPCACKFHYLYCTARSWRGKSHPEIQIILRINFSHFHLGEHKGEKKQ